MDSHNSPKFLNLSTYDTSLESRLGLGVKGSQVHILSARPGEQRLRFPDSCKLPLQSHFLPLLTWNRSCLQLQKTQSDRGEDVARCLVAQGYLCFLLA